MRGILIDPFAKKVTGIKTSGKLAEIYELLGVELITAVSIGEEHSLFLDDEGLLVPKASQEYWQLKGSNQPYAGKGSTSVKFSAPGEYALMLLATDYSGEGGNGEVCCWTNAYVKVSVK